MSLYFTEIYHCICSFEFGIIFFYQVYGKPDLEEILVNVWSLQKYGDLFTDGL